MKDDDIRSYTVDCLRKLSERLTVLADLVETTGGDESSTVAAVLVKTEQADKWFWKASKRLEA
jgi:hypothetical protein